MILAITNQKGGVSKTTTAQALAAGLKKLHKKKTLMIDLDPQCNLTYSCGIDPDSTKYDIADVLEKKSTAKVALLHAAEVDIIPGNYLLTSADVRFTGKRREYLLSDALAPLKEEYDFIIIDCPPTLGILTINALTAADALLIPINASIYSLQGLGQLTELISTVKKHCNSNLKINGLLLTRYRKTNVAEQARKAATDAAARIDTKMYETVIREGIAAAESQIARESVLSYSPRSNVAKDYEQFIKEFLKGVKRNGK